MLTEARKSTVSQRGSSSSDPRLISVGCQVRLFSTERICIFHQLGPFWSEQLENGPLIGLKSLPQVTESDGFFI